MSTPTSWLERQLVSFACKNEKGRDDYDRLLKGVACRAREEHPDDNDRAFDLFAEWIDRIKEQEGVDDDLISEVQDDPLTGLTGAERAWKEALTTPVFVPISLDIPHKRSLKRSHNAAGISIDHILRDDAQPAATPGAARVYSAFQEWSRLHGLPRSCVGLNRRTLAKLLNYWHVDVKTGEMVPDHSRAGKDLAAAVKAGIIAVLDRGEAHGPDRVGGLSGLYALRAEGETIDEAVALGRRQRAYAERAKLRGNQAKVVVVVTEPVAEPVFVSDLPPVTTSCSPQPAVSELTPAAKVQIDEASFLAQVDGVLVAELRPYELSGVRYYWNDERLLELAKSQPDPVLAARSVIEATLAAQPAGAPF